MVVICQGKTLVHIDGYLFNAAGHTASVVFSRCIVVAIGMLDFYIEGN